MKKIIMVVILIFPTLMHAEPPSEHVLYVYGVQPVQTLTGDCRYAVRGLHGEVLDGAEFSFARTCTSYLRGVIDAWMIATGRFDPDSYVSGPFGEHYTGELIFCPLEGESLAKNKKRAQRELNLLVRHLTVWVAEELVGPAKLGYREKGFYSPTEALLVELEREAPCAARKDVPLEDRGERSKKP